MKITIRAARVNAGLNRKEAAQQLDITTRVLLNYEHGITRIPASVLERMEKVYNMPIQYMKVEK